MVKTQEEAAVAEKLNSAYPQQQIISHCHSNTFSITDDTISTGAAAVAAMSF